jgi:hypothetical protein
MNLFGAYWPGAHPPVGRCSGPGSGRLSRAPGLTDTTSFGKSPAPFDDLFGLVAVRSSPRVIDLAAVGELPGSWLTACRAAWSWGSTIDEMLRRAEAQFARGCAA